MRIKFRAWKHINTPEMFNDVQVIDFKSGIAHLGYRLSSFTVRTDKERLDNLILMQYTGLKDKNGTEIYEGDILRYYGESREVIYQESSFGWIEDGNYYAFTEMALNEIPKTEVIGNIYEHHDLLGDNQ